MSIPVFLYDPPSSDGTQRSWEALIGPHTACQFSDRSFTADKQTITEGIIVAHRSKLSEEAISADNLIAYCETQPRVTVLVISGGPPRDGRALANLYYRRAAVSYAPTDPFGRCFERFVSHLSRTNQRIFRLLEPVFEDAPNAVALVILCEGYLILHGRSRTAQSAGSSAAVDGRDWWLQPFDGTFPRDAIKTELSLSEVPEALERLAKAVETNTVERTVVDAAVQLLRAAFDDTP